MNIGADDAPQLREGGSLTIPEDETRSLAKGSCVSPSEAEFRALATFRSTLRRFLAFSEQAAADVGLTTQRYQALLVIKTYCGEHISVGELAEELMIKDNSAAELVSRLVQAKLVRRRLDPADRRRSLLVLTASGHRRLSQLAAIHLKELRKSEGAFIDLFKAGSDGN